MKRLGHTYINTCIHSPPELPSYPCCHVTGFPVLHSRSLSVIHSKYSSVLIPNSLTIPSPILPPSSHKFVLWVCESLSVLCVCAQSLQPCPTLCDSMDCSPPGSSCPWDYPSKNTGVGCLFLLQIFPTQIKPVSPVTPALAGGFLTSEPRGMCFK